MFVKTRKLLQATVLGGALTFGALGMTAAVAQDTDVPAATEEDEGFDDWGLLGLLGLAGLAGLRKQRSEPEVRTVDRPVTSTTQR